MSEWPTKPGDDLGQAMRRLAEAGHPQAARLRMEADAYDRTRARGAASRAELIEHVREIWKPAYAFYQACLVMPHPPAPGVEPPPPEPPTEPTKDGP